MPDTPKLIWHSNAPWSPTGYGNQTGLFVPRLMEHYDTRVSAFYGLEGAPIVHNGVPVLPGLGGTYGNEALPCHVERFFGEPRGGLVVTLIDVWVLNPALFAQLTAASWVPVDHEPAPPAVLNFFRESGVVPLAMSRFGQDMLQEFDPLYVPHGVDTTVLRPLDRAECRAKMGVDEDVFMVGMVAANKGNPSRKSFVAALEAFAAFQRKHEDAKLYLHTDFEGKFSQGVPLLPVCEALGIPPQSIGHTDPYVVHFHPMSPDAMAIIYSAMDVLLNPATGEGFGIPLVEAQSCGVPVIVTDFSAMSEVCGAGWKVEGSKVWTGQQSWQMVPSVADIADALEESYRLPRATRAKMSAQARTHALQYDVEVVLEEHMLPALEQAQERLADRPVELVA